MEESPQLYRQESMIYVTSFKYILIIGRYDLLGFDTKSMGYILEGYQLYCQVRRVSRF